MDRLQLSPGTAVGAGGAMTVGENGLGAGRVPGAGLLRRGWRGAVVVVVVVVVVVSGAFSSSLAHDAVSMTIAVIARATGDSRDAATQN